MHSCVPQNVSPNIDSEDLVGVFNTILGQYQMLSCATPRAGKGSSDLVGRSGNLLCSLDTENNWEVLMSLSPLICEMGTSH